MHDYLADLLRQMKALGASELFLTKGKAPSFRINGRITTAYDHHLVTGPNLHRRPIHFQHAGTNNHDVRLGDAGKRM